MKKIDAVQLIFSPLMQERGKEIWLPQREKSLAFAPTNIALCKYWGKRNSELNLPVTSSLSIALPDKGAMTSLQAHNESFDRVILNKKELAADSHFVKRLSAYLDLFRPNKEWYLHIEITSNIPIAAGVASSACGFASMITALNELFDWRLSMRSLSLLARLGSGSAARSLWKGFVEWHAGIRPDGMDSYAEPMHFDWPELCVGLLLLSDKEKIISSRAAMQRTVDSSLLYDSWPRKVIRDMVIMRQAIKLKNFSLLAGAAESNALTMHGTILSSWPPICFFLPETIAAMHQVWKMRKEGLELYFTQDAGPNLKLLFLEKYKNDVLAAFPQMDVNKVFID